MFSTNCDDNTSVSYCRSGDTNCSLEAGTNSVKNGIPNIVTDRKFSVYIQDVVSYLLMFLGIVGVLYIIYAGFNVLTAGGDDDKLKKAKSTILHVTIGLLLIFLAYSIVQFVIGKNGKGGVLNNAFEITLPTLIDTTYAYTDYDGRTFDFYKKKIELLSASFEQDYKVNGKLSAVSLSELKTLVTASMDTFPDQDEVIFNTNTAKALLSSLEVVRRTPDSDAAVVAFAKDLKTFLTGLKIGRVNGTIKISPDSGNAPFTATLRAEGVSDPSGVTLPNGNYIWWIRTAGGAKSVIGTGPSIAYTFPEERTYTVFLNILSASRNSKGNTDVLPFAGSANINVLPRLGNLYLYVNSTAVGDNNRIKFTPSVSRNGLTLDATSSTPATGTRFVRTSWDFGNGNTISYNDGPRVERQIYANQGTYQARLELLTNEGQKIVRTFVIEVNDPIASIRADKKTAYPNDEVKFSVAPNTIIAGILYDWKILDLDNDKTVYSSNLENISYKFPHAGNYSVKLRSSAPNGKEDVDTYNLSIEGRDPVAAFTAKIANSESPNTYLLDATKSYDPDSSGNGNLSYSWLIDGDRTDLANPSRNGAIGKYTFDTLGTHRIALEVTNAAGKMINVNQDIEVTSLLSAKLVVSPKIVMAGNPVTIIADSKAAKTYEWQFGDGDTDMGSVGRAEHTYKKSGTYNVSVTVHGINSQDTNTVTRKVYVMDATHPLAIASIKRDGEELMTTADSCDGNEAYVIDRAKPVTISASDSVNTDGNASGLSYVWKYAGRTSSQREFSYKFDDLGCFPIDLSVGSQKSGKNDHTKIYVKTENLLPHASSLGITADKLDADPVMVTVTANNATDDDGAIVSYTWYYYTEGDPEPQDFRITRTPKTVFVLPRVSGKYFFSVILEDSNGAKVNTDESNSEKYSVTLTSDNINTPILSFKASDASVSVGKNVEFNVGVKNILGNDIGDKVEYKWDWNGDGFYEETTNTGKKTHTYDTPGVYNAKVKVTYKGISNTKYVNITVKNELTPNLEYQAIGSKFILFNTTKGLYKDVKWKFSDGTVSTNLTSFVYDATGVDGTPSVTLEVSDGTTTKEVSADLKKDVVNALRIKKSDNKLVILTYPGMSDDTVHLSDPSDKFFIYLGDSKGAPARYVIDTDTKVDSDLNGNPADDTDNKGTDSNTTGAPFLVKDLDTAVKERTMKISIYSADNTLIESKDIKVILDYADTSATASGSTDTVRADIAGIDKTNMEKLKDMIKQAPDRDRLKFMQYYSSLQDNWFDAREKAKTIIDFETYIGQSSLSATDQQAFESILEGFLVTESAIKGDIGVAANLLKSLIPKSNAQYTQIMKNIDDILSHPTNTPLNKELGKFILDAVKNDASISNADKLTIKSQLEIIIAGGQSNVTPTVTENTSSSSGILDFLMWFLKVLAGLLGLAVTLMIALFVYFKVSSKEENIGFQDFLIERIFGKGETGEKTFSVEPKVVVPKEDLLANLAPMVEEKKTVETNDFVVAPPAFTQTPSFVAPEPAPVSETTVSSDTGIPDWLKQTTTLASEETAATIATPEVPSFSEASEVATPTYDEPTPAATEPVSDATTSDDSSIPDWLKGTSESTEVTTPDIPEAPVAPDWLVPQEAISEPVPEILPEVPSIQEVSLPPIEEPTPAPVSALPDEELPAWLQSMDQQALSDEVNAELSSAISAPESEVAPLAIEPTTDSTESSSHMDDLPDWLKPLSIETTNDDTASETKKEEKKEKKTHKPKTEHKEQIETPEEVKSEEVTSSESEEAPKKEYKKREHAPKKPTVPPDATGAADVKIPDDQDLPDWLK